MKILSGFIAPTNGSAQVDGNDVVADSLAVRECIGYLPENAPVYTEMLVRDYLEFICQVRGLPEQQRPARMAAVVEQVGLEEVLGRSIDELSKGFRQRVGLAQALIHDPPILILDEPTSGLDPNQIVGIRSLIRDISENKTILLSTHILQEVSALCSRVLIVSDGQIVGFGTPAEIEAQAAGSARVEVVLVGEGDVRGKLAALPGVVRVDDGAGEGAGTLAFSLVIESGADVRGDIFALAVASGWTLLELRREGQSLEDAFRVLTTGVA